MITKTTPKTLDAVYERRAMEQGMNSTPVFKENKKFTPHPYQCQDCNDIIQSTHSGEWVACKCGKSFVDETEYYVRVGSNAQPYIEEIK
jgi:hypothetical protein